MLAKINPTVEQHEDVFLPVIEVNYRSIVRNNTWLLPILSEDAKIINVGSEWGRPEFQDANIRDLLERKG